MQQPLCFVQAEHNVHILNGTSGLPFYQVIYKAHHNKLPGPFVHVHRNIAEIAASYIGAYL